jgi:putative DNA primase/helicase
MEQVQERVRQEEELMPAPAQTPVASPITTEFVESCLRNNERGDGILYSVLQRNKLVYVKRWDKKPWLVWRGHHWLRDEMGEHMIAVDQVAVVYNKTSSDLVDPIKRERGLLDQASARQTAANKRARQIAKLDDADPATLENINTEGKEAEADVLKHTVQLKSLLRLQKAYHDRIDRLRSIRGARNCIEWSHHHEQPLAIHGRELDQRPWLLACPNGVIDLQTGCFRPGDPEDYLLRTVATEFPLHLGENAINHYLVNGKLPDGSDPHPRWTAFKASIQPDQDVLECMDRIMGYAITGFGSREQFIAVFLGAGRNGKGTYFKVIQRILGDLAWSIQPEFILEDKNPRSTASASPDILMIQGRRIIIASENDEKQRISGAKVKRYTGGNKINARGLFAGDEENFEPTWTMFLETNHIPEGLTKDFALRQRLILIDFPWLFVDDPSDMALREPGKKDRFRKKDGALEGHLQTEDPYILLDLLRCCLKWQAAGGINPPERLKANVEELTVSEDIVQQFINSCCLTDWSQFRNYNEGEACNIPREGTYGGRYISRCSDNKGRHPLDPDGLEFWNLDGLGCLPDNQVYFKEFYARFKTFYEETQSENDRYRLTKKAVGAKLREKGLDVRNRGRGTVITGPLEVLPAVE